MNGPEREGRRADLHARAIEAGLAVLVAMAVVVAVIWWLNRCCRG